MMKKSGDNVPQWMLELKQCDPKEWRKLEKKPPSRKPITTAPRAELPKRFLKQMEKTRRQANNQATKIKEQEGEDGGDDFQDQPDGGDADVGDDDEWVEDV